MTPRKLLFPEDVRASLKRRYASRRQQWLAGAGAWPLVTALGAPREKDLQQAIAGASGIHHRSPLEGRIPVEQVPVCNMSFDNFRTNLVKQVHH